MITERETIRTKRAKLRKRYGVFYENLSSLFLRHDPIGISFVDNPNVQDNSDEYEPEVGTILPRLQNCLSEADCLKVIHEEFCRWFGGEEGAGPVANYESLAHEAWIMWNDGKLNCTKPELD